MAIFAGKKHKRMVSHLIDTYIWLIQTLTDAGRAGLSLSELSERHRRHFGSDYPRRTFNNHRTAVADLFGVEIVCDRSTNRYSLDECAIDRRQAVDWLVNTFSVNSLLALGKERLTGRVSVEDIPSGHKYLTRTMEAMIDRKELLIEYKKYDEEASETLHVHPYGVKESARRWYVVAWCVERGGMRTYGMDRILSLEPTGATYRFPKDFDLAEQFVYSYGPYLPEGRKPELVRLKAFGTEAAFLQDLPLHQSQTLVERGDGYAVFRLYLIPTKNFIMELCRHGARIEVLEPASLRAAVRDELKKTIALYEP